MENKRIKVKKKRIRVAAWVLQGQLPPWPHGAPHGRLGGRSPAEVVMVGPGGCPGQMQPELVLITVLPPPWSQLPPTPATPTPPWPGWTWVTSGSTGGCSRASSSRAQQSFCWTPSNTRAKFGPQQMCTSLTVPAAFVRRSRIDTSLFWLLTSSS